MISHSESKLNCHKEANCPSSFHGLLIIFPCQIAVKKTQICQLSWKIPENPQSSGWNILFSTYSPSILSHPHPQKKPGAMSLEGHRREAAELKALRQDRWVHTSRGQRVGLEERGEWDMINDF